ncbi:MAG: DUF1592 domain-containing protein [Rhodospirillaceae bacterium]|nr:DUF1592 domain-containing protein [Rhodospirillaceae bacterium]
MKEKTVETKMKISNRLTTRLTIAAACGALALTSMMGGSTTFAAPAAVKAEPVSPGGPAMVRRLTPSQYQQIISDVFGPDIKLGGRFEPDVRKDGLLAVGTSGISVSISGLAQYDTMARTIASQVVDEQHRAALIPCKPANTRQPDEACARQFLEKAGRMLYRRPLTQQELQLRVAAAGEAATTLKNFYSGLSLSLAGMLSSSQFLFRHEMSEADPENPGMRRLDSYSKAQRLSFFLWNTAPDSALLAAAESGEIQTKKGLEKQVTRMLASPRLEDGVRAFFTDMLEFDRFANFAKDPQIYPKFTGAAADDAQEQTLRTIVDQVLTQNGDYRDLFTTRKTFLTPLLGSLYSVPVAKVTANGAPDQWTPYEYPEGDPRGVGILTQASFVALHSHPGRSSPTVRGKAVREVLLCQRVPDPPGNVAFNVVQDTADPVYKTARARLKAHATEAMCTGCHKITDPIGLAMENFDSAAGFRTRENGETIDTTGDLNGKKYNDAIGLGQAIHDDPATASCLVNKLFAYASGRTATRAEREWMAFMVKGFADGGYRIPSLMRQISTSDAFYRVKDQAEETKAADASAAEKK